METYQTRDVVTYLKGDTLPVALDPSMSRWDGGQGVIWTSSSGSNTTVESSDWRGTGFMLVGSAESSDQFTGQAFRQTTYRFGVIGFGGWIVGIRVFETYTYASRQSGPLVENTFTAMAPLYWSLRGLLTVEDELTESADPQAPNPYVVGAVLEAPSSLNNHYLTAQLRL